MNTFSQSKAVKEFKVVVFGNYLPKVAGRLRMLLTDALLRLTTKARSMGSYITVVCNPNDQAAALILRTCSSLSVPVEEMNGVQIKEVLKSPNDAFLIVMKVAPGDIRQNELLDSLDTYEEYVERILSSLDPACMKKELVVFCNDNDLGEMPDRNTDLTGFKFVTPDSEGGKADSYSDFNAYINSWYDGVRRIDPVPYHDLHGVPPDGEVNTKMAADPTRD